MTTGMNFMDWIKCLFYNTLSLEIHCGSWMWLIQEIVKIGYQREGGLRVWFCRPHASFTELKEPLSKFKGKQLLQKTQMTNLRPHLELVEDSRSNFFSNPQLTTTIAIVWLLGIGIWRYFISSVKTMRIKIIAAYWALPVMRCRRCFWEV